MALAAGSKRRTLLTRPSSVKVRVGLLSPVSGTDLQVCARLVSAGMETINGCAVVTPGDGPEFVRVGPAEMDGAYVVEIMAVPPGEPGPPLHLHPNTDEAFFVAQGEATFLLGDHELSLTTGGFVFVPRGTPHTVWNSGDRLARGLLIISPGEAEHEFVPVEG